MNRLSRLTIAVLTASVAGAGVGTGHAESDVRSDDGRGAPTWSAPVALSPSSFSLTDTSLAAEVTGEMTAAWVVSRDAEAGVWVRRRMNDGSWGTPQLIDPVERADVLLRDDPSGGVCAQYSFILDGDPRLRIACAGTDGVFQSPVELGTPATRLDPHRLTVDRVGTWTAAWIARGADGIRRVEVARRAPGLGWSKPRAVSPARTSVRWFDMDTSPKGVVTVAWAGRAAADRASPSRVHVRTLRDDRWLPVQAISAPGATLPEVTSGTGDHADVLWVGRAEDREVIQTRRRKAGGWSGVESLSRPAPARDWQYGLAQGRRGGSGVTAFAWVLYSPGDFEFSSRAYVVVRTNGRWGPVTRIGPTKGATERVRLAVDSAGTVIATWLHSTISGLADSAVVWTRRKPRGMDWQQPGRLSGTVSADVEASPTLVLDDRDRPSLVWVGVSSHELTDYAPRVFLVEAP